MSSPGKVKLPAHPETGIYSVAELEYCSRPANQLRKTHTAFRDRLKKYGRNWNARHPTEDCAEQSPPRGPGIARGKYADRFMATLGARICWRSRHSDDPGARRLHESSIRLDAPVIKRLQELGRPGG